MLHDISLLSPHRDFGSKVITLKPIVKQLQRLLEDRDKTVREEGKLLVVEIYHWIGVALRPQLSSLKPVQVGRTALTQVMNGGREMAVIQVYSGHR